MVGVLKLNVPNGSLDDGEIKRSFRIIKKAFTLKRLHRIFNLPKRNFSTHTREFLTLREGNHTFEMIPCKFRFQRINHGGQTIDELTAHAKDIFHLALHIVN